jgi:hypothetical protein
VIETLPDGHDAESYRNWMRDAGLSSVDTVALPSEPAITVITARSAGCRR